MLNQSPSEVILHYSFDDDLYIWKKYVRQI